MGFRGLDTRKEIQDALVRLPQGFGCALTASAEVQLVKERDWDCTACFIL